jgi:predicted ATPase
VVTDNLFVITGGPGSGKTTLLLELEKLGYRCAPEVARQIIQEQVLANGEALPWRDRRQYLELMLERSVESYEKYASTGITFFDRGVPDCLAYARLIGLQNHEFIRSACDRYRYAASVFLAPPWREIYTTDRERKQDFDEAERTWHLLGEAYQELGYDLILLPKVLPAERAAFIVRHLSEIRRAHA